MHNLYFLLGFDITSAFSRKNAFIPIFFFYSSLSTYLLDLQGRLNILAGVAACIEYRGRKASMDRLPQKW